MPPHAHCPSPPRRKHTRTQVVAGNRAGAVTVLLDMLGHYTGQELQGEERPHFLVTSLHELRELMSTELELRPPAARQP